MRFSSRSRFGVVFSLWVASWPKGMGAELCFRSGWMDAESGPAKVNNGVGMGSEVRRAWGGGRSSPA